jgi:hypothetical protein
MDSDVSQSMIVLGVLMSNLTIRVLLFCKRRASDYDNSTRYLTIPSRHFLLGASLTINMQPSNGLIYLQASGKLAERKD